MTENLRYVLLVHGRDTECYGSTQTLIACNFSHIDCELERRTTVKKADIDNSQGYVLVRVASDSYEFCGIRVFYTDAIRVTKAYIL